MVLIILSVSVIDVESNNLTTKRGSRIQVLLGNNYNLRINITINMRIICKISSLFCDFYEHWGKGRRLGEEIVRINIMIQHMGQTYILAVRQITTHSRYLFLALIVRLIKLHRVQLASFMFFFYRCSHIAIVD